jgi:hypothetical protein
MIKNIIAGLIVVILGYSWVMWMQQPNISRECIGVARRATGLEFIPDDPKSEPFNRIYMDCYLRRAREERMK